MVQWFFDSVWAPYVDPVFGQAIRRPLRETRFYRGCLRLMYFDPGREENVQRAALLIVLCPVLWNVVSRWEYRTRFLSKRLFGGSPRPACYAFAAVVFCASLVRDHLFLVACQADEGLWDAVPAQVGLVLQFLGLSMVVASFWRLGIVGTYCGDYFGILLPRKVTAFPFSVMQHPMYDGATAAFLGTAIWYQSTNGFWLTLLVDLMYFVAKRIERYVHHRWLSA
jgi:phosphatidylethanolamine N-methyltransferase